VTGQKLGAENDIAGLVDTMDVTEGGGDGEHWANDAQCLVDFPDLK
jgi:hypothetical protein